jgi:hypothetical protein
MEILSPRIVSHITLLQNNLTGFGVYIYTQGSVVQSYWLINGDIFLQISRTAEHEIFWYVAFWVKYRT